MSMRRSILLLLLLINFLFMRPLGVFKFGPPPEGMVLIPAGYFIMGTDDPGVEEDERPARRVHVAAFYIDRYEVTNGAFKKVFPEHVFAPGRERLPVTNVTKAQAEAYCRAIGKRLPSNAEWEKAARGTDGRRFPWGDNYAGVEANIRVRGDLGGLREVGSFPDGVSPYGVYDMSGNAWEWVADVHRGSGRFLGERPPHRGILRGGAHGYGLLQARCSYQGFEGLENTCNDTGFRCAMDAIPLQYR